MRTRTVASSTSPELESANPDPDKQPDPADSTDPNEQPDPAERMTVKQKKALVRIERACSDRAKAAANKSKGMFEYELPEVELIRKGLERQVVGLTIKEVEAASLKCLRSYFFRKYFTTRLAEEKVLKAKRIGLYITMKLSGGNFLIMTLGSSSSPRWIEADNNEQIKNTEVTVHFNEGGRLLFVDPAGTGQLFIVPEDDIATHIPEIATYGHDPLTPITWTDMGQRLLQQDCALKTLLTDNLFVTGIGPMYADEILFDAGLRYDRAANTLSSQEIRRLHRSIGNILHNAMKYGGASLPKRPFVNLLGREGIYAKHIKVWQRHGKLSARSRDPIKRVKYQGSWTYYCDTQI